MRSRTQLFSVLWLCLVVAGCSSRAVPETSASSPPPAEQFPLPVIELAGSGAEMGETHGRALGPVIRQLHDAYFTAYFRSAAVRFLALTSAGAFENYLSLQHRDEIAALATQTHIDERQMMLAQCFLDLAPMTACSTIALPAAASPDGVARFGRNLDFPSFNVADKQTVVLVYHPSRDGDPSSHHYQFAAIGWPGLVGVLSGMNEHGLALANMEVSRGPRLPSAMPCTMLYRSVLEQCRTVDEAIEFLRQSARQTANNVMLMDAAGARAVAEITPQKVVVRRGEADQALISTNHQRGGHPDLPGRCQRYDTLHDSAGKDFGGIDERAVERLMARVQNRELTLQSMVFEPANRVVYLSAGKSAASGRFHRLDLKQYFVEAPLARVD